MKKEYDNLIKEHYESVAKKEGLSWSSTMADEITRKTETYAIRSFIDAVVGLYREKPGTGDGLNIADIGCGNGYTLGVLAESYPQIRFVGVEMSDDLRELAAKRFDEGSYQNVELFAGDIRNNNFSGGRTFDGIICQRVLINLLAREDQKMALKNILSVVKNGGYLLFLEAFQSSLSRLNKARKEFNLDEIPSAYHNLYLTDDFFDIEALKPFESAQWDIPPNVLSTHYYVSRVLFPLLLGERPFKRNSEFVKFFSQALPPAIGDYSQLRIIPFTKCVADDMRQEI